MNSLSKEQLEELKKDFCKTCFDYPHCHGNSCKNLGSMGANYVRIDCGSCENFNICKTKHNMNSEDFCSKGKEFCEDY